MKVLALIGFLALSACHSGWEQDPFSGQSDNIQKAVPQGGNPVKEPPVQDVMRVDVKETHVVREGESLNLTMAYRLLHPEFSFGVYKGKESSLFIFDFFENAYPPPNI